MPRNFDEPQLDRLNLDTQMALGRVRKMMEWMRTVCENEAQILHSLANRNWQSFTPMQVSPATAVRPQLSENLYLNRTPARHIKRPQRATK